MITVIVYLTVFTATFVAVEFKVKDNDFSGGDRKATVNERLLYSILWPVVLAYTIYQVIRGNVKFTWKGK